MRLSHPRSTVATFLIFCIQCSSPCVQASRIKSNLRSVCIFLRAVLQIFFFFSDGWQLLPSQYSHHQNFFDRVSNVDQSIFRYGVRTFHTGRVSISPVDQRGKFNEILATVLCVCRHINGCFKTFPYLYAAVSALLHFI